MRRRTVQKHSREELPHAQGQGQRLRGATPCPRSGVAAERSNSTSKEQWLHGAGAVERRYLTFKVRKGSFEEIPHIHGKEWWLCFAGAAVKRYPMSKVRETQDGRCCERASEGRHTETTITEN